MSVRPTVSVLVPCRNAERYLRDTLTSALSQSLAASEIIVVDDGSTDRSAEIARSFGDRVTVVPNSGRGVSAARNYGSETATGEFLQYLDADDLLESHALASRVEALNSTGADVAISDWQRLVEADGTWKADRIESGRLPAGDDPADLKVLRGFWAPPAAILYRRSIWERGERWRETLPVIQDARFLFDAARCATPFVHVEGVGAQYRQHAAGSVSSGGPVRFWSDVLQNTREVEQQWALESRLDARHREAIADLYDHCARMGFQHDRDLFERSLQDLRRFPDCPRSRFVRAASLLTRAAGYRPARVTLAPFIH